MIRMDGVYCPLCDEYFFDKRQRAEHIMNSNDRPECWRCGRRFLNGQILHDDDSNDDSEEEDYYDLEDGGEDERGKEECPDEVSESGDEPLDTSWEDSNEDDFETRKHMTLCAAPCGHVYCVRCIRAALKYTEACPVCDERATEDQLRKIYISQE
ncbi:putative zinc-finger-containing protein [Desarmillaria ectypa]|nr:putative zinc-finger-containing protein [Desarmillaria ectypa]